MTPDEVARHTRRVAAEARLRNPDRVDFYSAGETEVGDGRVKVRRPHWPEGAHIEVPGDDLGTRSAAGAVIPIRYHRSSSQLPWASRLSAGFGLFAANSGGTGSSPLMLLPGAWTQSNQGSDQNATGNYCPIAQLSFLETEDIEANHKFYYPTNTSSGSAPPDESTQVERNVFALGLARAEHSSEEEANFYLDPLPYSEWVIASPIKLATTDNYDFYIAGFEYNSGSTDPLWRWKRDFSIVGPQPFTRNLACFFYLQLGRWCNVVPSPDEDEPICYSGRAANGSQNTSTLPKPAYGLSFHGYLKPGHSTPPVEDDARLLAAMPYVVSPTHTSIKVLQQNLGDGSLSSYSELTIADLVDDATITPLNAGHQVDGPAAWSGRALCVWASGNDGSEKIRRVSGTYLPETGEKSVLRVDRSAQDERENYTGLMFLSEAAANFYSSELFFDAPGVNRWKVKAVVVDNFDASISGWSGNSPVLLPAASPNTNRFGGDFGGNISGHPGSGQECFNWPSQVNSVGGHSVDGAGYAWSARLYPVARVIGGNYATISSYEDADRLPTFRESRTIFVENVGTTSSGPTGNYYHTDLGDSDTVIGSDVDGNAIHDIRGYADIGPQGVEVKHWQPKVVYLWETKLVAQNVSTREELVTDISQRFTVSNTVKLTQLETEFSGTQSDVPAADNVWKIISIPEIKRVAVLRDLHADGASGSPAPYLEIYAYEDTPTAMSKIYTLALGTLDLLAADTLGEGHAELIWLEGDREWDAYQAGPPRMKAVLRTEESGEFAPQIMLAVFEKKKVASGADNYERAKYHRVDLTDPTLPTVTTVTKDSGANFVVTSNFPQSRDWDSVVMASGSMAWLREGALWETVPR